MTNPTLSDDCPFLHTMNRAECIESAYDDAMRRGLSVEDVATARLARWAAMRSHATKITQLANTLAPVVEDCLESGLTPASTAETLLLRIDDRGFLNINAPI